MFKNFVKRTLVIILLFIMAIQTIPFSMYGIESFAAETTVNGLGPLCFTAEEAGAKVKLYKEYLATAPPISLEYKTEGTINQTWQNYTIDTTVTLTNVGDKVYFRNPNESDQGFNVSASKYAKFSISEAKAAASGDITSLINKNGTTTLSANCFYSLFYGCDKLTEAPALPATNLANECYYWMFRDCRELRKAPVLPATNLADSCYYGMFYGCNKIIEAPELPATTLAGSCYNDMFNGCQNLEEAPILPATTMVGACYGGMFWGCSKLKEAPALPATTLAGNCYQGMFQGCSALEEAPALPATVMATRCYSNMFGKCWKLKKAPALPATNLEEDCYNSMFVNCYKLENVKVNFTDWGTSLNKTKYWLDSVSSNGTFTCPNSLPGTTGSGYIPSNWTISKFTSPVPVEKITASSEAILAVGDTEKLTVSATNNSNEEATFADCIVCSADDTSIVSVKSVSSGKIKIKGLKTGTTTLTIWNSTAPSIKKICTVIVDGTKPTAALSSTNNLTDKQSVTLTGTDNNSVEKYYFGTDASSEPNKTDGINTGVLNKTVEVSASGTYYLVTKDAAGNKSELASITFYKTTFVVSNGSTNVEAVLTASGESFALPTISANASYIAPAKWSNGLAPGTNYEVISNADLTAVCKKNIPTYIDTLVQGKTNFNIGKVTVSVNTLVENGIAKIEDISKDELKQAVNNNSGKKSADSISVSFPNMTEHIESIIFTTSTWNNVFEIIKSDKNNLDKFEIIMSDVNMNINDKALKSINNQAKGQYITVSVKEKSYNELNDKQKEKLNKYSVSKILNVSIESDEVAISDLKGGRIIVKMKFKPENKKATNYKFYHISQNGNLQRSATKYAKETIKFASSHFSDFALVYKTKQETIPLKAKASGSNRIKLSWNGVDTAKKYVIYGAKKNKAYKKLKTIMEKKSYTVKKVSGERIKANNSYKFYIVEYDCFGNKTKSKKITFTLAKKK